MTGNPVGLVEFLLARYQEREADANYLLSGYAPDRMPDWYSPSSGVLVTGNGMDEMQPLSDGPLAHFIAANDPAYVLQDIAAKQKLVAYWSLAFTNPADVQFAGPDWDKVRRAGEWTLKLLAAPFSSHPDWQPEWSTE